MKNSSTQHYRKYLPFRISCFRLVLSVKHRERGWSGELGKKWNRGNTLNGSLQGLSFLSTFTPAKKARNNHICQTKEKNWKVVLT